jgi:RNA recognition motif-containing protein
MVKLVKTGGLNVRAGGLNVKTVGFKAGGRPAGGKGGGGKGGGSWMFVPQAAQQRSVPAWAPRGKGAGGGSNQGLMNVVKQLLASKGAGKGGKGKGGALKSQSKFADKLAKIDKERKVWVGGLSAKTTWKTLEKHAEELLGTKPSITEMMGGKGRACLAFKTLEDAESAISTMNGSELDGTAIEVDVWTQKERTEKSEKPKQTKKHAMKVTASGKVMRGDPKLTEKLKTVDNELKVWVGGLAPEISAGYLRKHFKNGGCTPQHTNLTGKDRACLAFKTVDEAQAAISALNGTTLESSTLEVDAWVKEEREPREKKSKAK